MYYLVLTPSSSMVVVVAGSEQADDGQTNSVSFETICLAVERRSELILSGRRASFRASELRLG